MAYTKPGLRERLKNKVMASSKGGKPGQWSARKAQMLAQEYKSAGGGYSGSKSKPQKSLSKWTKEEWGTKSGKPSTQGKKAGICQRKRVSLYLRLSTLQHQERKEKIQRKESNFLNNPKL